MRTVTERAPIVGVVDDDLSVREALGSLVRSTGLDVAAFASADDFLAWPPPDAPSCLVLDVHLPGLDGLDLQRRLGEADRDVPIIFITGHADVPTTVRAMKAGAVEFLTKPFSERALLETILQALERNRADRRERAHTRDLRERYASLTPREKEVTVKVVAGLLNKQIAAALHLSEITVKVHRGQAMHKMRAGSLADLVRMVERLRVAGGASAPAPEHTKV